MRASLMVLAALLLIQLLATTAHGIRLDRQLHEALNSKQELATGDLNARQPSDTVANSTSRRCGNCSGKARKPVAPHAAAAKHQIPTKRRNGDGQSRQDVEFTTASHAGDKRHPPQQQTRTYPDIAGMDYSPATRKPHIHN